MRGWYTVGRWGRGSPSWLGSRVRRGLDRDSGYSSGGLSILQTGTNKGVTKEVSAETKKKFVPTREVVYKYTDSLYLYLPSKEHFKFKSEY